jgi:hypothetical protein
MRLVKKRGERGNDMSINDISSVDTEIPKKKLAGSAK